MGAGTFKQVSHGKPLSAICNLNNIKSYYQYTNHPCHFQWWLLSFRRGVISHSRSQVVLWRKAWADNALLRELKTAMKKLIQAVKVAVQNLNALKPDLERYALLIQQIKIRPRSGKRCLQKRKQLRFISLLFTMIWQSRLLNWRKIWKNWNPKKRWFSIP